MSQIILKTSASAEQTASSPLAWLSRAGFGVITLLAIALFGWANPVFLTVDNWANLLQGSAILLIVAMAMTLIVSAGAIDLSVGVALDFGAAFRPRRPENLASAVAGRGGLRPAWRRAGGGRQRLCHAAADDAERHGAAAASGESDPARAGGSRAEGARRRGAAGQRADLLLP